MRTKTSTIKGLYLPGRRTWSRDDFYKVVESGVFPPDARLELIEGEILVREEPMRAGHASAVWRCDAVLRRIYAAGFLVRTQLPLALGGRNEPLPDVAVVAGSAEDFDIEHPTTAVLVVEVSDSTLRYDRTTKASLYARAGIPEYWILNLTDRTVEVHRTPQVDRAQPLKYGYASVEVVNDTGAVSPLTSHGSVSVTDLLPSSPSA